jgi:hypothetical protein
LRDSKTVVVANVSSAVTLAVFVVIRPAGLSAQIGTNSSLAAGQPGQAGRGLSRPLRCCCYGDILAFWFKPLQLKPVVPFL